MEEVKCNAENELLTLACPSCAHTDHPGETGLCFINVANGPHRMGKFACWTCKGALKISEAHAERIRVGKLVRADRIARCFPQREEAERLGISLTEYSDIEQGRVPKTEKGRKAAEVRKREVEA